MTTYTLRKANPATTRTDAVVIGVAQGSKGALVACPGGEGVAAAYGRRFAPLLSSMGFKGEPGSVLRVPTTGTLRAAQLIVVGMGARDDLTLEKVRRAAGLAARSLSNVHSIALALPAHDAAHIGAVVDGFVSGGYRYDRFKGRPTKRATGDAPSEVIVLTEGARRQDVQAALTAAQTIGEATSLVRDWVNDPPNVLTPEVFAHNVEEAVAKVAGLDVQTLDAKALKKLGCGGILGVGQASANPPCLVKLTWQPAEATKQVALIGKGITYDSGGLSIKPGSSMTTMKCDMAGAAAAAAAIRAVAQLNIPVGVTAWLPMAENAIAGNAMRPGDVLTMYGGRTVEVLNTDAEGRLLLADALGLAVEEQPDVLIDIATLTGACVVALGPKIAGLFGDDQPTAAIEAAASKTGELFWRLPIPPEARESVRTESKLADVMQHNWVRWGSASYAAAFLEVFTDGLPWAHLDIAGPGYNSGAPWGHVPSGGTGFGVSTLVEFVSTMA